MARVGSLDGSYATIDLSDASDLVSYDLVRNIFKPIAPTFLDYVEGCRSETAKMPSGELVTLRKFASMGSAMCFPMEAMIFFTLAMTAFFEVDASPVSRKAIKRYSAKISVYGDDIIVPSRYATAVMDKLEAYGLRVNHSKSFTQGFFRESCGGDYYRGHDVTPVYIRRWQDSGTLKNDVVLSSISLSNQFYMKGYWNATQHIRDSLSQAGYRISRLRTLGSGIHYVSTCFDTSLRWDPNFQSWNARTLVPSGKRQPDVLQSEQGVFNYLGQRTTFGSREPSEGDILGSYFQDIPTVCAREPSRRLSTYSLAEVVRLVSQRIDSLLHDCQDIVHDLETSVRPYSLKVKSRWTPAITGIRW
jgi:hypothetical protein